MRSLPRIRVVLCDDHDGVRSALRYLVNASQDLQVVGEARDGASLLAQVAELDPDVVLLDVSLPDMTGIEAASILRRTAPAASIVALSAHEDQAYVDRMRAAGAAGYVKKRVAGEELVRAIREAAAARGTAARAATPRNVAALELTPGASGLDDEDVEVLKLLASGHTHKQISSVLQLELDEVESRKARTMAALGLRTRADVVRYAKRCGWLTAGR